MGYSRNPNVVTRCKTQLDTLLAATSDVTWVVKDSHMTGYWIREAMTVAEKQGIKPYHELKGKFIIRDKGGKVVAELRERAALEQLKSSAPKLVLADLTGLLEILGACVEHKSSEMYFPGAALDEEEIGRLYNWCRTNNYFIIAGDGITITKTDPGDIAWTPSHE